MTTNYKSLLALFAALSVAANLSCATELAQSRAGTDPTPRSQDEGAADDTSRRYGDRAEVAPAPTEKIVQTVFPIPDILCETSPTANRPTANHLEDTIVAALDDLRKPRHAKANTPGGPIVKVHAEAGILVFSGTWEQTELVRSTLQALKDTAQERQSKDREKAQRAKDQAAREEGEYSKPPLQPY